MVSPHANNFTSLRKIPKMASKTHYKGPEATKTNNSHGKKKTKRMKNKESFSKIKYTYNLVKKSRIKN